MRFGALLIALAACSGAPATRPGDPLPRAGDEFVANGRLVHTTTKVVLWFDPGGLDLTRSGHYGERDEKVTQVVVHYDAAGTSKRCHEVLEKRKLSCHFLLDLDGTVYQTLDLDKRAWHARAANSRSIGIEIANIGAYADATKLAPWYGRDAQGVFARVPEGTFEQGYVPRPARPALVRGAIHGQRLFQYDLTNEQYEALGRLLAALVRTFPGLRAEAPASRTVLADPAVPGIVGHYHLQRNKVDPGPAFDWDRVLRDVETHLR